MRRPKITCYRYKNYTDIYISNVFISIKKLLSVFDILPDGTMIALIDLGVESNHKLSIVAKEISEMIYIPNETRIIVICDKSNLLYLLGKTTSLDVDGMFIADGHSNTVTDELIYSLEYNASRMVKKGNADMSFSIDFLENQMIVSIRNGKHTLQSIKDKIYSAFRD